MGTEEGREGTHARTHARARARVHLSQGEREGERGGRGGLGERRAGRRLKQNDNYFWPLGTWRLAALLCPVLICMPVMLK